MHNLKMVNNLTSPNFGHSPPHQGNSFALQRAFVDCGVGWIQLPAIGFDRSFSVALLKDGICSALNSTNFVN